MKTRRLPLFIFFFLTWLVAGPVFSAIAVDLAEIVPNSTTENTGTAERCVENDAGLYTPSSRRNLDVPFPLAGGARMNHLACGLRVTKTSNPFSKAARLPLSMGAMPLML